MISIHAVEPWYLRRFYLRHNIDSDYKYVNGLDSALSKQNVLEHIPIHDRKPSEGGSILSQCGAELPVGPLCDKAVG